MIVYIVCYIVLVVAYVNLTKTLRKKPSLSISIIYTTKRYVSERNREEVLKKICVGELDFSNRILRPYSFIILLHFDDMTMLVRFSLRIYVLSHHIISYDGDSDDDDGDGTMGYSQFVKRMK